jgi:uncharacterized lipoprotein YajG
MNKFLVMLVTLLLLAACSMPTTTVRTTDTRPGIAIDGAPDGAILYVDGHQIGEANKYDGQPNVLVVEPGTHTVVVKGADGAPLFDRKIYVESELKTIKVH